MGHSVNNLLTSLCVAQCIHWKNAWSIRHTSGKKSKTIRSKSMNGQVTGTRTLQVHEPGWCMTFTGWQMCPFSLAAFFSLNWVHSPCLPTYFLFIPRGDSFSGSPDLVFIIWLREGSWVVSACLMGNLSVVVLIINDMRGFRCCSFCSLTHIWVQGHIHL